MRNLLSSPNILLLLHVAVTAFFVLPARVVSPNAVIQIPQDNVLQLRLYDLITDSRRASLC